MKGETVAIVGESGSGKSVTMKAAMGILASNATVTNGKRIAMVFQDPMTSLDPTITIGKQIMEGMIWHFKTPKKEAWNKAVELQKEVGIARALIYYGYNADYKTSGIDYNNGVDHLISGSHYVKCTDEEFDKWSR